MPLIEYKCVCGNVFEQFVALWRKVRFMQPCEKCGGIANRVEFARTGAPILKKGIGGFYSPSRE